MEDQMSTWTGRGLRCVRLSRTSDFKDKKAFEAAKSSVRKGHLIFSSPEALEDEGWWEFLRHRNQANIRSLILDEAHLFKEWGKDFRTSFKNVPSVLAILPASTPVLALTGTASRELLSELQELFDIEFKIQSIIPDRPNIELVIKESGGDFYTVVQWYVDHLVTKLDNADRCIIYCRTMEKASLIYSRLVLKLKTKIYTNPSIKDPKSTIVEQYHAHLTEATKTRVLQRFLSSDSSLRCVVATVALGLGVDLPDIRYVLMWGPPSSVNTYWQQAGRAGRDGIQSKCILYRYPGSDSSQCINPEMKKIVRDALKSTCCIRASVLDHLKLCTNDMQYWTRPKERCCSVCNPQKSKESK